MCTAAKKSAATASCHHVNMPAVLPSFIELNQYTYGNYIPFLGVLWGEVRGEESREEAFDWLSSGGFRGLSLPFSDRDKILWRDWGDWAPTDTKTPSQYKQDLQVTSRGRSNNTRTQLICIGTTEKSLTKWW